MTFGSSLTRNQAGKPSVEVEVSRRSAWKGSTWPWGPARSRSSSSAPIRSPTFRLAGCSERVQCALLRGGLFAEVYGYAAISVIEHSHQFETCAERLQIVTQS